ncbi:hypothetical protein [Nocardia gipuzkoensis]
MRWAEPLAVRMAADYLTREPVGYLTGAGFRIEHCDRTGRGGVVFRVPARKRQSPNPAESGPYAAVPRAE